jgi:ketosteroid isomerase-like protein
MSRAVAMAMYQAFNRRDFEAALEVIDPAARWEVIPTGQNDAGPAAFLAWARGFVGRFPDAAIEVQGVVEQGDRCAVEFVARGTDGGGRRVAIRTCEVLTFAGGKIVNARIYFDRGGP